MDEKKKKRDWNLGEIALKVLAVLFMGWLTVKIILINVIDFAAFISFIKNLF